MRTPLVSGSLRVLSPLEENGKSGGRIILETVLSTDFTGTAESRSGKVREIYDLGQEILLVATDRVSAFDVILPVGIPGKGEVLNRLSEFWFERTRDIVPNHMISTDTADFPEPFRSHTEKLAGRSMLAKKTEPLPVECVVRGYICGSGWEDYKRTGAVCGISLPSGLAESQKLEEPIFTPATKAERGAHDENVSFDMIEDMIGGELSERIRDISVELYLAAACFAEKKGVIIADTKFEFGTTESGELLLIDEALTPDSSRFWPADEYAPGRTQRSFDKQFVRDYLKSTGWDRRPPAPALPPDIVEKTREKYQEILEIFLGDRTQ